RVLCRSSPGRCRRACTSSDCSGVAAAASQATSRRGSNGRPGPQPDLTMERSIRNPMSSAASGATVHRWRQACVEWHRSDDCTSRALLSRETSMPDTHHKPYRATMHWDPSLQGAWIGLGVELNPACGQSELVAVIDVPEAVDCQKCRAAMDKTAN